MNHPGDTSNASGGKYVRNYYGSLASGSGHRDEAAANHVRSSEARGPRVRWKGGPPRAAISGGHVGATGRERRVMVVVVVVMMLGRWGGGW